MTEGQRMGGADLDKAWTPFYIVIEGIFSHLMHGC